MERIDTSAPNQLEVTLAGDETIWFHPKYLQSRRFGRRFLPPWMTGAPIGRILHGSYWLARLSGGRTNETSDPVKFAGPSVTGRFRTLELGANERYFVNLRNFVGILLPQGRDSSKPMATHLGGLASLHCWLIGHPLPVIFTGPATVILYGQNLDFTEESNAEHLIQQVVAFDASKPFNVLPTETDGALWSDFTNGLTLESRLSVEHGRLLVEQAIPEGNSPFRLPGKILVHLGLAAAIALVIFLLSVRS